MALPLWKIRREVKRLGVQLRDLPGDVANYLFATRRYDRTLARQVRRHEGRAPETPRVAIFLIYPDQGLQPSHLRTLDYFRGKGYSVLAVSNLPLSASDRETLLARCRAVLERPNFGYDFGGYRDAILSLAPGLPAPERLVLINDSTWFPLPGSRDWLDDAEALGVDFAGAASNFGTPRPEIETFRSMRWTYSTSHRDFHYGSFALLLGPAVLQHPGFLPFWRGLALTDKKKRTVRRGEIGFTQWALRQGFSHGATLDLSRLDRDLSGIPDDRLAEIAKSLIILDHPKLQALWRQIIAAPEPSRDEIEKLILLVVSRQGASYALASYATRERGFPFLKKSPVWLNDDSARITLALLGARPGCEELLDEAQRLRRHRQGARHVSADA